MTKNEALKKAFKQAFQLGQDYWYQADHEYESQNKKSDVTRAKFEQLMEDAIKEALAQPESEYERGFIDGMQKQMQSSVDKAVNAMTQPTYYIPNKDERTWVGLTKNEVETLSYIAEGNTWIAIERAEAKLKEKNT